MKQLCEYSRHCFYDSHLDTEACENEERRCCEPIKAANQRKKKKTPFPIYPISLHHTEATWTETHKKLHMSQIQSHILVWTDHFKQRV